MRRVIFLAVVGGLGLLALVSLGIWQMQRLTWKENILSTIETRIAAAPVPLPDAPTIEADRYRAVTISGEIEPEELHAFWVTEAQGAGYRVISPFVTDTGRRILVDRGYIRAKDKDDTRPTGACSGRMRATGPPRRQKRTPISSMPATSRICPTV